MAEYKINQGDTLTAIAQKFGTTPDVIAKANNISNPNLIYAGSTLNIPESGNQIQQVSSTMPANASIINPKSTIPAPAVITPSLAETTTKKNLNVLYNAESIPKISQSSTPVLSVSSTNPTVSANIEKINQALSDPKLASLLTPEIRQAISNINSLGTQAQTLTSSARNSADTQDYRSLNDYVKQLQETKKKVDESTMALQSQLQPLRDRYIASLNPSQQELDLGIQLNNIRSKIADFNISAVEGQQAEFGLGRPLALSTGRAEKLGQQAALTRQSLLNEESNLLSKLGLAQEARRAQSEGIKTGISMLESDIALQDKAYERIRQQEADVFTRFQALNTIQRQNAADILESLKGVDPSTLSPEVRSQIAQVAESRGIPSDAIFAGLQTEFTKNQLDILSKRQDVAYTQARTRELQGSSAPISSSSSIVQSQTGQISSDFGKEYQSSANSILAAARNLRFGSVEESKRIIGNVQKRLSSGDIKGAEEELRSFGYQKLPTSQQSDFNLYDQALSAFQSSVAQLDNSSLKAGPYKALYESSKPWLGIQKDKKYADLRSTIELGQAQLRKAYYGTAVTGTEAANAKNFLINDNDDIDTIKWKLENASNFLQFVNDATIARAVNLPKPDIKQYIKPKYTAGTLIESGNKLYIVGTDGETVEPIASVFR